MAKIKIKEVKCPCCGAHLSLKDNGYGEVQCNYCNAIVFISREDTNDKGFMTITNKKDGRAIASICIPLNWDVTDTFINYNKSVLQIPYSVGFDLENTSGDMIHVETGNAFEINGPVGWVNRQTPRTIQKEFMPVEEYIDKFAEEYAKGENKKCKFIEDLNIPVEGYKEKEDFERTKSYYDEKLNQTNMQGTGSFTITGLYSKCGCRAYEIGNKVLVIYTKVYGWKTCLSMFSGVSNGISSLGQGLSNMLGNMANSGILGENLSNKIKGQTEEKNKSTKKEEKDSNMIGNLDHPGQGEVLEWQSGPMFVMLTSKDNYKKLYSKAYKQVCSTFELSPEVVREHQELENQFNQEANGMYQQQAQAQYQHGQSLIQMGQQRMAANYAYIDSMRARSNQQFESQRSAYNNRMAAQDRMRDQRTEAILGVNTYIKPDGHEVEVPVSAETAWINGKGEIIGGSAGFNPGPDWTQLDRK